MARHCFYFVAIGGHYQRLTRLAVESLYLRGYAGDVLIVTDGAPWNHDHVPPGRVAYRAAPAGLDDFAAKRLKPTTAMAFAGSGYDAVMFLDSDILAMSDPTPLMDRVAADPGHLYAAYTSNRRLMATTLAVLPGVTDADRERYRDQQMVDSYAVGFVPNAASMALMAAWDHANGTVIDAAKYRSDCHGLNYALLRSGRLADVVFMPEAERLNGRPSPGTVLAHYVYGQWVKMPAVHAAIVAEVERERGAA
ncbi:MAG: hypothetical protein JWO31_2011 [Phycisphaerales bacterium]|nr:hypothetical protein [Phycisphaerales bacterium]